MRTVSFFFQAEDGIRDLTVTGVQTCALPIYVQARNLRDGDAIGVAGDYLDPIAGADLAFAEDREIESGSTAAQEVFYHILRLKLHTELITGQARLRDRQLRRSDAKEIGRASCRERV